MMMHHPRFLLGLMVWGIVLRNDFLFADAPDYARDIKPILTKYCVGCHNEKDHESDVQLQSLDLIQRGTADHKLIVSKDPANSAIFNLMSGSKEPKMPPEEAPQPTLKEVELVRQWIEQGALGKDEVLPLKSRLSVKRVLSTEDNPKLISSIGMFGKQQLLLGGYSQVSVRNGQWTESLPMEVVGKVTQIRTTHDGRLTVIAAGIPGVGGQATIVSNESGSARPTLVRVIEAHNDTLYTAVLSPDGKTLATAGYDRIIMLWNVADGKLLRKLEGHNGAVYDLDFDATGSILVSASADETIKVWRVSNGERLDTFGQCEAEQYAVRFDSIRDRVIAAGADKRIRVWKLLSKEKPSVSPMLFATFAHEASVTQLATSSDGEYLATAGEDKLVKLWRLSDLSPLGEVATLPEVPSGLLWNGTSGMIATTLSGVLVSLDASKNMKLAESSANKPAMQSLLQTLGNEITSQPTKITETSTSRLANGAMMIPTHCEVTGTLTRDDVSSREPGDWYAFEAMANEPWIISVAAKDSPMDCFVDVLDSQARPILRTRLQALRESYFTFRGKDSTNADDFRLHRWEDMELNEYLYAGGEVVRLWLYPRGPDSGFKVYPGIGNRFTYFDTTATTHALNEPAWIVKELSEGEPAIPNGLPVFPIYYTNDDAANRLSGKDSQLTFRAKESDKYLVRVRDARGQSGDNYHYKLTIQKPNPRFQFRIEEKEITLRPGAGTEFSVVVDRWDGCDGEVDINVMGLPDGLQITKPFFVQSEQNKAMGLITTPKDVSSLPKEFEITVECKTSIGPKSIDGGEPKKLKVKINDKPTMPLKVVAINQDASAEPLRVLEIRPGTTVSVKLLIERGENTGDISFGKEDSGRNLPHGCYVDNIGLSGLLIPAGQSEREVFITAAPWVPPQERLFHLESQVDGKPSTLPILLKVVQ